MKEMVGGCCVCSDESGWDENPLVYCDGDGCDVAVHQACYGIVSVPVGPWFCRKCESQDRSAITRCELCPGKGGALKQTDSGGWAHVVCALYIPEVRFGDVATMEPVLLSHLPPDRFGKPCCLCEVAGRTSRATTGATMSCNKPGCRQNFHVTCAQSQGLLCEEQVQSMNVTYCGYCPHHYAKLKRGHNLKPIPAFKASHDPATPDTSPEKQPPPPGGDGPRVERRHKKPKQSRSPRAAAASPPEVGASPAVGGQGAAPFPQAVVKLEPVGPLGMDGAAAVHSSLGGAGGGEVTPARALGGQEGGAPDSVSADSRDGSLIKQETGVEQPPPVALLPAAGGAAGQVASLPVATSTALPAAQQAADVDLASLKRPAVPADGDARKRKATGRPRKGAAGAGSPEPGADGTWNGAVGTDAAQPAGSATARGGAAAVAPSGLTAPHMIGNHLNPATPLGDSLAAEMAEQADYLEPTGRMAATPGQWRPDTAAAPFPRSLTELLERQWQQGSHFLMEQSQHMDIAALLSCLYQLRQENEQLEQHMGVVSQRRDHLLAVHARLSVPLQCAAPGVVSARAAAVRQQQAAANDAELNGGPFGQLRSTPPRPAPLANGQLTEGGQPAAPAPAPARAPPQTNGRSSGPASAPQPAPTVPQQSLAHGGVSSGRPGPAPQPPPPAPVSRPPVSTSAPPPASRPQPAVSRPQTSASRPPPPANEHRTVEALRLRVSATSSGGFPRYQLVSPPSDGRSGSGRSRASDG
ncbi:protein AF-10-like isoform X1 [Amphibalanus amphitrite]|uniref:protein AF-10-like isoform X1 n=1 Tax=Amphibalanus amphitrite TaxID=1232801 RepID=UPI001C90A1A0|nr:protein AF-10-like isoform X1 [Amphibalanus amphitrite]